MAEAESKLVRGPQRILRRTKPRFGRASAGHKCGAPSAASTVCDERSEAKLRTTLDTAPGSKKAAVSLDKADAVIDGNPGLERKSRFFLSTASVVRKSKCTRT